MNKQQELIIEKVLSGEISLPKTKDDFAFALKQFLLERDLDSYESKLMSKTRLSIMKLVNSGGVGSGVVYRSYVSGYLDGRKFYKSLCARIKSRGVEDPLDFILNEMKDDGLMAIDGNKLISTTMKMK
jgi:hypothetical protein